MLLVIACVAHGVAHAESDGNFCVGEDYLALERWTPDGRYTTRTLTVIPLGEDGIGASRETVLALPQPHRLCCEAGRVRIATWTEEHDVDLDDLSTRPIARVGPPRPAGALSTLGIGARPGTTHYPIGTRYRLVVDKRVSRLSSNAAGEEIHVQSTLIDDLTGERRVIDERHEVLEAD